MIEEKKYQHRFFKEMETTSYTSAKVVLPYVNNLFQPRSVIDIGCGTGEWLKVWEEDLGVKTIKGVEGPYIDRSLIKIKPQQLVTHDLKLHYSENVKYDLAMSLEVGEHLPASSSEQFVKTLTGLSDVVLFSAAIPHQVGTYHINEQYPEYWAEIFLKQDFVPVDVLREILWNLQGVEYWYKQNTLLFIHKDKLKHYPELMEASKKTNPRFLFRLHPDLYELKNKQIKNTSTFLGFLNWKWVVFKYKYLKKQSR